MTDSSYADYSIYQFIHYYQQVYHVLKLSPKKVLEIGPGLGTVAHFLRGRGVVVKTYDIDPHLRPDYCGDVREPLRIDESFDVVLASEVFEHCNIKYLETILENLKKVIAQNGCLVVSLPYSTIRLFPDKRYIRYGRFVSCAGRLYTRVPYYFLQFVLTPICGLFRIIVKRQITGAFDCKPSFPQYSDNECNVHHWDLGYWPTRRSRVRELLKKHFDIVEEKTYINTNSVFFTMRKCSIPS